MPHVLGLDIGGANLKGATSDGSAATIPFLLWKQPEKLTGGLIELLLRFPGNGPIAVTMTGELCDCFANKAAGVKHILESVQEIAEGRPVYVWRNDGKWASITHAMDDPKPVASANWLAAATFAGRYLPDGPGWFLDLGSTTFDLIPMLDGKAQPQGKSDLERLQVGELAYLGVSRTPVCAITQKLAVWGHTVTTAAELFATVADAYVLLDLITENPDDRLTADQQPRTKVHARRRLARMVCADEDDLQPEEMISLAQQVARFHRDLLMKALFQARANQQQDKTAPWGGLILAGSGGWLLTELIAEYSVETGPVVSLSGRLGPDLSEAACAYGAAVLLAERLAK